MRRPVLLGGICAALAITGCATNKFPEITPKASARAQVRITNIQGISAFDAVFARAGNGSAGVDLYKGAPAAVLRLRVLPDGQVFVRGSDGAEWSGDRSLAPSALMPLITLASLYLDEEKLPNGAREIHSGGLRVIVEKREGKIRNFGAASPTHIASARFDRDG